jgi:hypothetical protein
VRIDVAWELPSGWLTGRRVFLGVTVAWLEPVVLFLVNRYVGTGSAVAAGVLVAVALGAVALLALSAERATKRQ